MPSITSEDSLEIGTIPRSRIVDGHVEDLIKWKGNCYAPTSKTDVNKSQNMPTATIVGSRQVTYMMRDSSLQLLLFTYSTRVILRCLDMTGMTCPHVSPSSQTNPTPTSSTATGSSTSLPQTCIETLWRMTSQSLSTTIKESWFQCPTFPHSIYWKLKSQLVDNHVE
jgi:hypothetical protein